MVVRETLQRQFTSSEVVIVSSEQNPVAVASKETTSCAALVPSPTAGQEHGLTVLQKDLQDHPNNLTRFLLISKTYGPPSGSDHTILAFTLADTPGSLSAVLNILNEHNVNQCFIQSSFVLGQPQLMLEIIGHVGDPRLQGMMDSVREHASCVRIVGSFPLNTP
eukprot:gene5953-5843_t